MLTRLIVAIISQYIQISNHYLKERTLCFGCQGNSSDSGRRPNEVNAVKAGSGRCPGTCWSFTSCTYFYWLMSPCKWPARFTASCLTITVIKANFPSKSQLVELYSGEWIGVNKFLNKTQIFLEVEFPFCNNVSNLWFSLLKCTKRIV